MSGEQLIVSRLLCELKGAAKMALGPGFPEKLIPYLGRHQSWIPLEAPTLDRKDVDVALVEAVEVSETGHMALSSDVNAASVKANRWVAVGILRSPEGSLQLVKSCTLPTQVNGKVDLVVTELGVVRVTDIGFELIEISPGVGSDDVRMQVRASLHVADDVKRIQLCA
jgi:hypothetical protein